MFKFLLFGSGEAQRLEEILVYLLGKRPFCVLELAISYFGCQLFTAGSSKMQMFTLDVGTDDHGLFSFCTEGKHELKSK